jgi:hypothetical protein
MSVVDPYHDNERHSINAWPYRDNAFGEDRRQERFDSLSRSELPMWSMRTTRDLERLRLNPWLELERAAWREFRRSLYSILERIDAAL